MRLRSIIRATAPLYLFCATLQAATINLVSVEGFLHYGGVSTPAAVFNTASAGYTSSLNAQNLGSFQFSWVNTTVAAIDDLTFTLFVDPDIDRDDNTYFNEYGAFQSFSLPILAPTAVIAFSDWEIDEPEYVFGNIYTNANDGALDNTNGVPDTGPADDVSMALLFRVAHLGVGETLTVTGTLSDTDAAGLGQFDSASNAVLYFNGYAETTAGAGPGDVPEPGSGVLFLVGAAGLALLRRARVMAGKGKSR